MRSVSPWNNVTNGVPKLLTTSWKEYTVLLTPSQANIIRDNNYRLNIITGYQTGTIWLDNISLIKTNESGDAIYTETPSSGNVQYDITTDTNNVVVYVKVSK